SDTTTVHTLADPSVGGLTPGRTYYVVRDPALSLPADTFQLALTPGGPAINLSYLPVYPTDASLEPPPNRSQSVGPEGLDLLASSGPQRLRIDLTGGLPGGTQQLLGAGGVPLSQVSPPLGDGTTAASSDASSGGLVDVNINSSTVSITQKVTAYSLGNLT